MIDDLFPNVLYYIDAADAFIGEYNNAGRVYIIKEDIVYEFDFLATETLSATLVQSFGISSTAAHPFNAIPQSPPQMPSGITALHTSVETGKTYAFVGSHLYIHEWGTGTWTYQGQVLCYISE